MFLVLAQYRIQPRPFGPWHVTEDFCPCRTGLWFMRRFLRGALGLENASREDIRLVGVTFGFVVTVVQLYFAPEFNPFGPAHRVRMTCRYLDSCS